MSSINQSITAFALLCGFACSGYDADDAGVEGEELGQLEQSITVKRSPTFQHGAQTSASRPQCNRTNAAQLCSVPAQNNPDWCLDQQFTAAQKSRIRTIVQTLDTLLAPFVFSEFDFSGNECALFSDQVELRFLVGTCSGDTGSNNIEAYSCGTTGSVTALTEGSGVVGTYQKHVQFLSTIDRADILAKGANATEDNNIFDHAVARAALTYLGVGTRTDAGANGFASRRTLAPTLSLSLMTNGERCRLESYTGTTGSELNQFNLAASGCAAD